MTVFPKHMTLPSNYNEGKGITGLKSIQNPFKVAVSLIQYIKEILSLALGQARIKARKSSLKNT